MKGLLSTPLEFSEEDDEETTEDYVWTQDLALRLAQRYLDSLYCTWRVTGAQHRKYRNYPTRKEMVLSSRSTMMKVRMQGAEEASMRWSRVLGGQMVFSSGLWTSLARS